jgi:hypothetical protein
MQKNREVRRTSTADSPSGDKPTQSSTPTVEAPKPAYQKPSAPVSSAFPALMKGKKDTLWQLLKSDDFQRIVGSERNQYGEKWIDNLFSIIPFTLDVPFRKETVFVRQFARIISKCQ